MFCHECGKQNQQGSKFCKHCGTQISIAAKEAEPAHKPASGKEKKPAWQSFIGVLALVVSYGVGRALGLVYFLLVIGWLFGYYFAKWIIKDHPNSKFFHIIAWLNIISWLSPIAGFVTAGVTYIFAQDKKENKYQFLWIIAIVLAVGNALLYPYVSGSNNTSASSTYNSTSTANPTDAQTGLSAFKTSYKGAFVNNCSKTSGANGQQYCGCMADYLINNYTEEQLTQFTNDYNSTHQTPKALQDAASSCVGSNTDSNTSQ